MKVTLAYPHDGHAADDTVELPDEQARQLLRDGYARPAKGGTKTPRAKTSGSGRATKEK